MSKGSTHREGLLSRILQKICVPGWYVKRIFPDVDKGGKTISRSEGVRLIGNIFCR